MLRALNIALVVVATTARAAPLTSDELDGLRDKLAVFEDGKHHVIALAMDKDLARSVPFWLDGTTLVRLVSGSSRPNVNKRFVTFGFSDPRYRTKTLQIVADFDTEHFSVQCDKRIVAFKRVATDDAAKRIATWKLANPTKPRLTLLLGREAEDTTYYYVDVPDTYEASPDLHLYVGKRGAMKQLAIKDQAIDSAGTLIITAAGKLRYTESTKLLEWLPAGGKPHALVRLGGGPEDADLIYNQLGIFTAQRFGTPCDDL